MEPEPTEKPISTQCVGGCPGHAAHAGKWTEVTVVGGCKTALANVYQVAVAGLGGTATFKNGAHGVVAVASDFGHASSGDGGVAVSSGGGHSKVESWGYAYALGGMAVGGLCSVAGTAGGYASAAEHGIGIGWLYGCNAAIVEAGEGGVAIGNTGCFVKVGKGGALIAMDNPQLGRSTNIFLVDEGGIEAGKWYVIEVDGGNSFKFTPTPAPPAWEAPSSPCIVPPKP